MRESVAEFNVLERRLVREGRDAAGQRASKVEFFTLVGSENRGQSALSVLAFGYELISTLESRICRRFLGRERIGRSDA